MPRTKERKTTKGQHSSEAMETALKDVIAGKSIRKAAKENGLCYNTLNRYFQKLHGSPEIPADFSLTSNFATKLVFHPDLEQALASYVQERSQLGYGLDTQQVRILAHDFAVANNVVMPTQWQEKKIAEKEWFINFLKRNQHLSLRTPEACSIARAAAFNKPNTDSYFLKLNSVLQRNPKFESGERVFNGDEIGTTTVGAVSRKIVAPKGVKQVHQVKSHGRGESVTSLFFVCATGTFLPPVMLFPRKKLNSGMVKNSYPNTPAIASGKKGYMNNEQILPAIKHFAKYSNSSVEDPTLLILDNFGAHITLAVILICEECGISLFTLPPHTTHRTQPLDVGVSGPFKKAYDRAVHVWTGSHPGVSDTIYEVGEFVNIAACQAMSPQNIQSAFKCTGIIPFNPNIFPEKDFVKSTVTYQADPNNVQEAESNQDEAENVDDREELAGSTATVVSAPVTPTTNVASKSSVLVHVSPADILPLPKAAPKTTNRKPRKKGRCMIATDTPEKQAIEKEELEKKKRAEEKATRAAARKEKQNKAVKRKGITALSNNLKKRQKKAVRVLEFENSSSDDDITSIASSASSDWQEEEEEEPVEPNTFPPLERDPEEGEYVLVEFSGKETVYYIGKILSEIDEDQDFQISYLRRSTKVSGKFVLPQIPDLKSVQKSDIKMILPKPSVNLQALKGNKIN